MKIIVIHPINSKEIIIKSGSIPGEKRDIYLDENTLIKAFEKEFSEISEEDKEKFIMYISEIQTVDYVDSKEVNGELVHYVHLKVSEKNREKIRNLLNN